MKEVILVNLPRPRQLGFKRRPEFVAMVDCIWPLIESDVRHSVREEGEIAAS